MLSVSDKEDPKAKRHSITNILVKMGTIKFQLQKLQFLYSILFAVFIVNVSGKSLSSSDPRNSESFRPPHFSQPIYKAILLSNDSIMMEDGPIVMTNAQENMYYVISSENYDSYSVSTIKTTIQSFDAVRLELTANYLTQKDFDVVILEALDEDLVSVSRTTVLIFNSYAENNFYKRTFKIADEEYIVLNYFYFKLFLGLLTVTGLLILIIELHEIKRNVWAAISNRKYDELQNV